MYPKCTLHQHHPLPTNPPMNPPTRFGNQTGSNSYQNLIGSSISNVVTIFDRTPDAGPTLPAVLEGWHTVHVNYSLESVRLDSGSSVPPEHAVHSHRILYTVCCTMDATDSSRCSSRCRFVFGRTSEIGRLRTCSSPQSVV